MKDLHAFEKICKRQVYGDVEYKLGFPIRDVENDEVEIKEMPRPRRCKYIGCITLLNFENAKDQAFCSIHQIKVRKILDRGDGDEEFNFYNKIVQDNLKRINRKTLRKT